MTLPHTSVIEGIFAGVGTAHYGGGGAPPATGTVVSATGPSSVNEGSAATINVVTADIPNGGIVGWAIQYGGSPAAGGNDFDPAFPTGSATVNSNSASFVVNIDADQITEGSEEFRVLVNYSPTGSNATTGYITINDTSTTPPTSPTITVTGPSSVNEGSSANFTVSTTNVGPGKTLSWDIVYGTASSGDFSTTSGSFVTDSGGQGFFSIPVVADSTTEGSETFQARVTWTVPQGGGGEQGTSGTVTINDTSTTPAAPVITAVSPSASNVNEGSSVTITVDTQNYSDGNKLFNYTINPGSGVTAGDFTSNSLSGTVIVNTSGGTGTGSFTITPTADSTTEGPETFTVTVTDPTNGAITFTSTTITINDTSTTPAPTYTFGGDVQVVEGDTFNFNASRTGGTGSTAIYYAITTNAGGTFNRVASADRTGSITFSSDSLVGETAATILLTGIQGTVPGLIRWYSDSGRTQELPNSPFSWSMIDADPAVTSVSGPSSFDEGTNATITVNTSNVPDGSTLNWSINHISTSAGDFGATSGTVTINSQTGSFTIGAIADATTENAETFTVTVSGTVGGTAVSDTSSSITINDTSQAAASMDSSFGIPGGWGFQSVAFGTFPEAYCRADVSHEPSNNRIRIKFNRGSSTQAGILNDAYVNYTGLSNITSIQARYTVSGQSCVGSCMVGAFGPTPVTDGYNSGTYYNVPMTFGWMAKVNTNFGSSTTQVNAAGVYFEIKVVDSVEGTFTARGNASGGVTIELAATDGSTPSF